MFVLGNAELFATVALLQNNSGSSEGCQAVFTTSFGSVGRKKELLTIAEVISVKNRTAIPEMCYIIFLRELKSHYE